MTANALARSASPYLRQHMDNPVDWREWSPEALKEARDADRPILLSIGYAACHWCHVMAHESFENREIAAVMNEYFIPIKVDREQRPDVDAVYMAALHALGEQGGWPLTMFLTPEGRPFWGGTYFPPAPRFGRPGFRDVLETVARVYREERDKVKTNVDLLIDALSRTPADPGGDMTFEDLDAVALAMLKASDPHKGGLRGAPKFPNAGYLEILLRAARRIPDPRFRAVLLQTLTRMSLGGIYDHIGGGYCRYAVDEEWLVPHFEKMLYDNALICLLLALASGLSEKRLFRIRIEETIEWLDRDMRIDGAYAASRDADSEGQEGKYYLWTPRSVAAVLGEDAATFCASYDITDEGNFEGESIPNLLKFAGETGAESVERHIERHVERHRGSLGRLLEARGMRTPPARDDKVLADWNGLHVEALATAGLRFKRREWIARSRDLLDHILASHCLRSGSLGHSRFEGRLSESTLATDYAFLLNGALSHASASGNSASVENAVRLADDFIAMFVEADGAVHMVPEDKNDLFIRPLASSDEAIPSAAGAGTRGLYRLGAMTGDARYREIADRILRRFSGQARANPFAAASLWNALDTTRGLTTVGLDLAPGKGPLDTAFADVLAAAVEPNLAIVARSDSLAADHPMQQYAAPRGGAAYVCRGDHCLPPIVSPEILARELAVKP